VTHVAGFPSLSCHFLFASQSTRNPSISLFLQRKESAHCSLREAASIDSPACFGIAAIFAFGFLPAWLITTEGSLAVVITIGREDIEVCTPIAELAALQNHACLATRMGTLLQLNASADSLFFCRFCLHR
jgi:hypothetical protein